MRLTLNVDQEVFDSAGANFEPVPAGNYKATVFEVTAGEVKDGPNKGKPRLNVQFRIKDGELSPEGRKVGNRRVFAGINAFYGKSAKTGEPVAPFDLVGLVKALGGTSEDLADLDTDDWLGKELEIKVAHEEKKTKESSYKESYNPKQYREVVKGYRSIEAAETAASASASVKAASGAKASSGGNSAFTL